MKEHQILFSAPMVRAILDGTKTQTRRVVKPRLNDSGAFLHAGNVGLAHKHISQWLVQDGRWFGMAGYETLAHANCPYGQPGDRLWVRETWGVLYVEYLHDDDELTFWRADYSTDELDEQVLPRWRASIHMPRRRCRIVLEITGVRVERLHQISEADAAAEGAPWAAAGAPQEGSHKAGFASLWESINGPGSWDKNPWVWVIEFKRVER